MELDWYHETVSSAIGKAAKRYPDNEALVQHEQRVTYKEMIYRARQLATGMSRMGVTPGEHVGILHPNDIMVVLLQLASACLGTIYTPFNIMFSPRDLGYILKHSDISTLFVGEKYRDKSLIENVLEIVPELREAKGKDWTSSSFPELKRIVQMDSGESLAPSLFTLGEVEEAGASEPLLPFVSEKTKPDDISHLVYTSGSTAFPKGVLLTHLGMVGGGWWWSKAMAMTPSDRFILVLPLYHTGGMAESLCTLLSGACLHIIPRIDTKELMETIHRERITATVAFDAQISAILEYPERSKYDISSLKKATSFTQATYEQRMKAGITHLIGMYALTEGHNPVALVMPEEKRYKIRSTSAGHPFPGVELKIIDPETEKEQPPGVPGEIRFRGWNCFVRYYKPGPEETPDKVFDKEGFFRSGDCGYLDDKGYLYFVGRYKDIVKTGGENVSPAEVENFIGQEIPGVALVQVIGIPDERWGEAVTAVIELKRGVSYTESDIIQICKQHLSGFKVPKHVFFIRSDEWPFYGPGKIRKDELRARAIEALKRKNNKP